MILFAHAIQHSLFPTNYAKLKFAIHIINAVLDGDTGEIMEMRYLMKNPKYRELWGKSYRNELGHLAQGRPGQVEGIETILFIDKQDIPLVVGKMLHTAGL